MVSERVSLKLKGSCKIFPQEIMAACENRSAPELKEKQELLENATPGSTKKATRYGMKNLSR